MPRGSMRDDGCLDWRRWRPKAKFRLAERPISQARTKSSRTDLKSLPARCRNETVTTQKPARRLLPLQLKAAEAGSGGRVHGDFSVVLHRHEFATKLH